MLTWILITVLSLLWVIIATVTAVLVIDCIYTLMDESRWRY